LLQTLDPNSAKNDTINVAGILSSIKSKISDLTSIFKREWFEKIFYIDEVAKEV
jgi:hypothetical protein